MKKQLPIFSIFIILSFIFWGAITLSDEYSVTLKVPVRVILPIQKFAVKGDIPENFNLKIRTTGWEIIKLKYFQKPQIEINVNEPVENYVFVSSSISNEQVGLSADAKILSIQPSSIRLSFDVSTEKRVKIYPRIIYSLKEGYEIVSPLITEPESILIRGTKEVLSSIDSLPTQIIQLSELSEFTSIQSKIVDTLKNLISYDKIPVRISFDVQQIVDREFEKIPIDVINVPSNKEVVLLPSFVDVKLRGGIKILGSFNSDSIRAFVDFKKYSNEAEENIIPEFYLPYGVKLLDYSPKQFKLILRK